MNIFDKVTSKYHVGYVVEDAEAALKAVQKQFGCALDVETYTFIPTKAFACGAEMREYQMRIAMCPIKDNVYFEYIQPVSPVGFHYISLLSNGTNFNHVSFHTDRFDECYEELKNSGAVIVFEAEILDNRGYRRTVYAKLDGVPGIIEILENTLPCKPQ